MKDKLLALASVCVEYKEILKLDEKDNSIEAALGKVCVLYQNKIMHLSVHELALLVVFLRNIKDENMEKYVVFFTSENYLNNIVSNIPFGIDRIKEMEILGESHVSV